MYVPVCLYVYYLYGVHEVPAEATRGHQISHPQELELYLEFRCLMLVLETKLRSNARQGRALNQCPSTLVWGTHSLNPELASLASRTGHQSPGILSVPACHHAWLSHAASGDWNQPLMLVGKHFTYWALSTSPVFLISNEDWEGRVTTVKLANDS